MASRIDPPVEISPSIKLVKQILVKEQAENSHDNKTYKSLYGEWNHERGFNEYIDTEKLKNQYIMMSKKRGVKAGSMGGSTTDLRMYRKMSEAMVRRVSSQID